MQAHVKLIGVWNIYDTAVSITFPVGIFITFCCVILRFTFWKLHPFVNINHHFWKNRCSCLSYFFFSLPLSCHTHSPFFPFYCCFLLFLMCGVFSCCFSVFLPRGPHQKYPAALPSNKGREQRGSVLGSW